MVYLNTILIVVAISFLFGNSFFFVAVAPPIFIKERYAMIKRSLVKLFGTKYSKIIYGLSQITGIVVISIGFGAISGYLTGKNYLYKWFTDDVGIALGTGIALLLVGLALYFFSLRLDELSDKIKELEQKFK